MSLFPSRDASPRPTSISKEVKFAANQAILGGVRTMMPGLVEQYDPKTKRAVVQPIIKQGFKDGSTQPRPPLVDVPVIQPSTSGYLVHLQIGEGDIVAILFTQTGLATFKLNWEMGMELVEPVPATAFTDAVAMPWGSPEVEPVSTEGIVLQSADGKTFIHLKDDRIELRVGIRSFVMTPERGDYR